MLAGDRSRRQQDGGFTLLEAMLALSILSIGLLATAAMQDMALSRNVDSKELGLATNLATEMIERIRYNTKNVTVYNGIDTANNSTKPSNTQQTMARGDYDQWQARLASSQLKNVRGQVTVTANGPTNLNQSLVSVRVTWSGQILFHSVTINTMIVPDAV